MGFVQRVKSRFVQLGSRFMQGINSIGVSVGETVSQVAIELNWVKIADACSDFVSAREASHKKWKDRADRAQRDAVIGPNVKPKVVKPTRQKRDHAERCTQILEEQCKGKSLNETLESLDGVGRMDFLKDLCKGFQEKAGVPIDDVAFYVAPVNNCGYYSREDNCVHINVAFLTSDNIYFVKEQVFSLFHEMTHALQWHAVKNVADGNFNTYGFSLEQVAEWAINFDHYLRPEVDPEGYRNQPIERDAYWLEWMLKNQFD